MGWEIFVIRIDLYARNMVTKKNSLGKVSILLKDVWEDTNKEISYDVEQSSPGSKEKLKIIVNYRTPSYARKLGDFQFGRDIQFLETVDIDGYTARIPRILVQMKKYLIKNDALKSEGIF